MIKKFFALIVVLTILGGCITGNSGGDSARDKQAQILGKMLEFDGVQYSNIRFNGDTVVVNYETSSADQYDDQIIADWAAIFGSASEFDVEEIVIINEINGIEVAELRSTKENIDKLFSGTINESEFWESVEIKAL